MSGLYTIFDCMSGALFDTVERPSRTGGRPFAARMLHDVVHYWAQAAHELATCGSR